MASSWGTSVHDSWCCLLQGPIHRISVQKKSRFPFFRRANNSIAGFSVDFQPYLYCCFSEYSPVPWLQSNLISADVCSFIRDFGSSSHPRLVSTHQPIHFYRVFIISGHKFFLDSKLYSQNFSCRISKLHQVNFLKQNYPISVYIICKITVFISIFGCYPYQSYGNPFDCEQFLGPPLLEFT